MKILHIGTDNQFVGQALTSFERVYPNQNTLWILERTKKLATKNKCDKSFIFLDTLTPSFIKKLSYFDLIVLHNFDLYWVFLTLLAPKKSKFAWLGWGFDYHSFIYSDLDSLLLDKTLVLKTEIKQGNKTKLSFGTLASKLSRFFLNRFLKPLALKRVGTFSPVLKEEYDLINTVKLKPFGPTYIPWNYGSLEEDLIKNFIGHRITGNSILLGNSSSFTNNHSEAIDLLTDVKLPKEVSVIAPLSYGDTIYRNKIIDIGHHSLGEIFTPIVNFMPIGEYVELIKKCGYVIMNHKRQQAVSNIVIMLYLGARVFLREENPTYIMMKKEGVTLNTIQQLERQPVLLSTPLKEFEIKRNIDILYKYWSKAAIDNKTKNLVEHHLGVRN